MHGRPMARVVLCYDIESIIDELGYCVYTYVLSELIVKCGLVGD